MNGLRNLNNAVYQGIIYPKENIIDKKIISEFPPRNGKLDTRIINFLSPGTSETPNSSIKTFLEFEK